MAGINESMWILLFNYWKHISTTILPATTNQDSDIPVKIIKDNLDIFKKILCQQLNRSIENPRLDEGSQYYPSIKKKGSNR